MKIYRYIASAAILAALVSCEKNNAPQTLQDGNTIDLSVSAVFPELTADGLTRVTFQGTDLVWEGTESIGVIIGDDGSKTGDATTYQTSELKATSIPGVFAGTVDLGKFTKEDIHGIVCPYDPANSWWRNNHNSTTGADSYRIVMQIGKETQIQNSNNVLNGAYAPLFAELSYDKITDSQLGNTVEGLQLNWGCALLKFNIYGSFSGMKPDETLKSISVFGGSSTAIAGTCEYVTSSKSFAFNGAKNSTVTTELKEACTIADKTQANGIGVYMALLPRNNANVDFKKLTIVTNRAVYTKTISKTCPLAVGTVYRIGVDLSTFDSRTSTVTTEEIYSTDGGTTWTDTCPASTDTFTSLTVKGLNLTIGDLNNFKTLIASQSAPVALDLSGCQYESTTWPKSVFTSTSAAPNTSLKSIKFPANVDAIEVGASNFGAFTYCDALESVDLSGIKTIGRDAFTYTGLTSVNVPKTCTSIGNQAFRWCYALADIYYDAPASTGTHMMSFSDTDATSDRNPKNVVRTITIGPDVTSIADNAFRSTTSLKTVIFEGSPAVGATIFSNVNHLSTIICKSSTPPTPPTGKLFTSDSTGALETNKQLIVPKGSKSAYESSSWAAELVGRGYVIVEADE